MKNKNSTKINVYYTLYKKTLQYYYYKNYWDWVKECYLEVKIEDEEYFNTLYNSYDGKQIFDNNPKYEEYLTREYNYFSIEENTDEPYIRSAGIYKILFDKEDNVIIFIYLSVADPYDLDDCIYYKKFIQTN